MTADRPSLLVLASTYPRWKGDTEPGFVHELCRRLARQANVTVLVPHYPGCACEETMDDVRVRRFRYAPLSLETLAYDGGILSNLRAHRWKYLLVPFFLVGSLISVIRALHNVRPDLVHAHWLLPQGIIAVLARAIARSTPPLVVTSHGADLFSLQGHAGRWSKQVVLKKAEAITVVSTAMRNAAVELGANDEQVHVLPMGVDLAHRFTPASVTRRNAHFLFIGRLVEKKGVEHLLRAFRKLHRSFPDATLEIVGDGPLRHSLQEQVRELELMDAVTLQGALRSEELPRRLQAATCLVMPSVATRSGDQEGFGLVQVEAMGCLCPVISSDLPAVRDVVIDGETGLLVPPGDEKALHEAMTRLLDEPQLGKAMAARAREGAVAKFDWEAITENYWKVLNGVVPRCTSSNSSR